MAIMGIIQTFISILLLSPQIPMWTGEVIILFCFLIPPLQQEVMHFLDKRKTILACVNSLHLLIRKYCTE